VRTYRKTVEGQTYFVIADADPALYTAIRKLHYQDFEDGFGKPFSSDTPNLDRIFANFERHAPDMVLQAAGAQPVPWQQGLKAALDILNEHDLNWYLVGSAALASRGLPVNPRDIDFVVLDQGARRLADIMLDYLIEPMVYSPGWISDWFGRTFLYMRVEWVGDVNASAEAGVVADYGPTAASRLDTIDWQGYKVKVPPLDLQLAVSEQRGLSERAALIRKAMSGQ
jgi:hypothetical protein